MSAMMATPDTGFSHRTAAHENLWLHFSAQPKSSGELPMIVRGEGAYVYDDAGNRYLDGLAGLFTVQVGHGRRELAQAAARQAEKLSFFPLWSYANEPAAELAGRLAALAPGDLNRVFFTNSGS
ncbi:MAG: aminotransferase class III-fold pyridoxal phosphate-dependent enzyme, partial [Specibacter sp.]